MFAIRVHGDEKGFNITDLSIDQGFNFVATAQGETFGHVQSLKINGTELKEDLKVINPVNLKKESVTGVLSSFDWSKEFNKPIRLSFQVSTANQKTISWFFKKNYQNLNIEFDFKIYKKSKKSEKYFIFLKSFTYPHKGIMKLMGYKMNVLKDTSYPLKGRINKKNNLLEMSLGTMADKMVTKPENFNVSLTIYPEENLRQELVFSPTVKYSTQLYWGRSE